MDRQADTLLETAHRPMESPRRMPSEGRAFEAGSLLRAVVGDAPGLVTITAQGDAFADALVGDGDVVLLQRDVEISSGELAAIRLRSDGVLRLRRVFFDGETVRLEPEADRQASLTLERHAVRVHGRVIAIARRDASMRERAAA